MTSSWSRSLTFGLSGRLIVVLEMAVATGSDCRIDPVPVTVIGMQVHPPVVDTRADQTAMQATEHPVARLSGLGLNPDLVEMSRVLHPFARGRRGVHRKLAEGDVVTLPLPGPGLDPVIEPRQLMESDRGLDIRHVELEANLARLVVLEAGIRVTLPCTDAEPVKGQLLDPRCEGRINGGERAALDRRDVFRGVEGVRGRVSERPDRLPIPLGTQCVGGVLDDMQPMLIPYAIDPVHVDRATGEMDGHDRPCAIRDSGLRRIQIHEAGIGLTVDEHGCRSNVLHRVRGSNEGHGRHEHLVPRAETEAAHGKE